MAPVGHIKLGPYNDIRPYILENPRDLRQDGANPYAAPAGGNQGYNDLQGWAEWTMRDWSAGAGQEDPEAGGFRWATAETRVPAQIILQQRALPDIINFDSVSSASVLSGLTERTLSPSTGYTKLAIGIQDTASTSNVHLWLFCILPYGSTLTVASYKDSPLATPDGGTLIGTTTINGRNDTACPRWEYIGELTMDGGGTTYAFNVLTITGGSLTWYEDTSSKVNFSNNTSRVYSGSWGGAPGTASTILTNLMKPTYEYGYQNGLLWGGRTTNGLWYLSTIDSGTITDTRQVLSAPTSLCEFDGDLYVGHASGNFKVFVGSSNTATDGGATGTYFTKWKGYLWKAAGSVLSYSSDGVAWEDFTVSPASTPIRAIAGMGENMYFTTDDGLYYLGPGDFTIGVMPFSLANVSATHSLVNFDGDLYLVAHDEVYRIDQGHSVMPITPMRNRGEPNSSGQYPVRLHSVNGVLFLTTSYDDDDAAAQMTIVWVWSQGGWHIVATVPQNSRGHQTGLFYSRAHNALYVTGRYGGWKIFFDARTVNPYFLPNNLSASAEVGSPRWDSHGWAEFPVFGSNVLRLAKDLDSVYIEGENLTGIRVYYRFDNASSWTLLGTLTGTTYEELRLTLGASRVGWRNLRLGVLLRRNGTNITPRIEAISVKYIPMVNDRGKWNLTIKVPEQMFDTDDEMYTSTYNQSSMITHLKACIASEVPLVFEDVDGTQYEVKVTSWSRGIDKWTLKRDGNKEVNYTYYLTVEQVSKDGT